MMRGGVRGGRTLISGVTTVAADCPFCRYETLGASEPEIFYTRDGALGPNGGISSCPFLYSARRSPYCPPRVGPIRLHYALSHRSAAGQPTETAKARPGDDRKIQLIERRKSKQTASTRSSASGLAGQLTAHKSVQSAGRHATLRPSTC